MGNMQRYSGITGDENRLFNRFYQIPLFIAHIRDIRPVVGEGRFCQSRKLTRTSTASVRILQPGRKSDSPLFQSKAQHPLHTLDLIRGNGPRLVVHRSAPYRPVTDQGGEIDCRTALLDCAKKIPHRQPIEIDFFYIGPLLNRADNIRTGERSQRRPGIAPDNGRNALIEKTFQFRMGQQLPVGVGMIVDIDKSGRNILPGRVNDALGTGVVHITDSSDAPVLDRDIALIHRTTAAVDYCSIFDENIVHTFSQAEIMTALILLLPLFLTSLSWLPP